MRSEEDGHRHRLVDLFRRRHGEEIPLLKREDIKGFVRRDPISSIQPWDIARIRSYVALMELETGRFYSIAAATTTDAEMRNCWAIWPKKSGTTRPGRRPSPPKASRRTSTRPRPALPGNSS